jgi:hypothetical protein
MGSAKKSHAAKAAHQVVEPEAGRRIQTQVINLVIGVGPRPARITPATSDRVAASALPRGRGTLVRVHSIRPPKTSRLW